MRNTCCYISVHCSVTIVWLFKNIVKNLTFCQLICVCENPESRFKFTAIILTGKHPFFRQQECWLWDKDICFTF